MRAIRRHWRGWSVLTNLESLLKYWDFEWIEIYSRNTAGRLSIRLGDHGAHILPYKEFRHWGWNVEWYDGPLLDFGIGPVACICLYHPWRLYHYLVKCKVIKDYFNS